MTPLSAGGSIDHRPDIFGILDPQVANMVVVVVLAATSRLNMQVIMMRWVPLVAFTQAQPCSLMESNHRLVQDQRVCLLVKERWVDRLSRSVLRLIVIAPFGEMHTQPEMKARQCSEKRSL